MSDFNLEALREQRNREFQEWKENRRRELDREYQDYVQSIIARNQAKVTVTRPERPGGTGSLEDKIAAESIALAERLRREAEEKVREENRQRQELELQIRRQLIEEERAALFIREQRLRMEEEDRDRIRNKIRFEEEERARIRAELEAKERQKMRAEIEQEIRNSLSQELYSERKIASDATVCFSEPKFNF